MKDAEKVNWIRQATLDNGTEIAVSEKTGIVKVTLPGMKNRSIIMYADEFLQLFGNFAGVQRYLETNCDVAVSRDASQDVRKSQRVQTRAQAKAAQALHDLGLNADDIKAFLALKQNKTA